VEPSSRRRKETERRARCSELVIRPGTVLSNTADCARRLSSN
jgi:hypothetical protein